MKTNITLPETGMPVFSLKPENPYSKGELTGIAEGLDISERVQTAAWLEASKMPPWAIEKALGLTSGTILSLRVKPDYREMVTRCLKARTQSIVASADGDIDGLLNSQIDQSVAALMEVRDNPYEKGANRIKASTEILDRATKAPKAKREIEERKTIISIPIGELQTMQQALIEEGSKADTEILELLKGVDFNAEDDTDEKGKEIKIIEVD